MLLRVTRGNREIIRGYRGLLGIIKGYDGLQGCTAQGIFPALGLF